MRAPRPHRREGGFTLLELVTGLAVVALILGLTLPLVGDTARRLRLRLGAAEVVETFYLVRATALRQNANVGVRFEQVGGEVTFTLYRDGDGDGVLAADVADGTDPPVTAPRRLAHVGGDVRFGFPPLPGLRDPSGRPLDRGGDPIRFNRSGMASFSPLGTATPGSLYLTDGRRGLVAVRVRNTTGKVSVLTYDGAERHWRDG
jgi:hypothetical protein